VPGQERERGCGLAADPAHRNAFTEGLMTRLRILLLSIGLAIAGGGLAGCAGSCSERVLLQPHAYPTADFKTSPEPEPDALWIDGRDLSLYLSPCYSQPDNGPPIASGPGTLCGTLILPPGVRFRFEAAQAALVDASSGQRTPLELHGVDFALTKEREGFDGAHPGAGPGPGSSGACRASCRGG